MKLFRICLLASLSLGATIPGTASAAAIYASEVIMTSGSISGTETIIDFGFSSDSSAFGNVLGGSDDGGKALNKDFASTGQVFLKVALEQAITQGNDNDADLKIINLSMINGNYTQAAAVWVVANDGVAYNVGSTNIVRDTDNGVPGVWADPTGGGTEYLSSGWVVTNGKNADQLNPVASGTNKSTGAFINLDYFFGPSGIYGTFENLSISELYISGYFEPGTDPMSPVAASNFDIDAIKGTTLAETVVPIPAAVWLFASGLIGLIAVGRKRNA